MDPVQKIWMFQNWQADQKEQVELAKNHAYLIGSFTNPEAVKELIGSGNTYSSNEDEFEESSKMVRDQSFNLLPLNLPTAENKEVKKRKRRTIKD